MSMPLRPGDQARLGRYELIGRLGEGGMGTVFLGRGPDGRLVAIKMVRTELVHDAEFRGRFRSEVNRAKQVPSFSTAEVLDADPDHEPPYLVVEYVDGPSLAAEIKDNGPLSDTALHSVAVGIATALTAIHGAGVIHRDLKPGNVLFARGGIKVIDFGIARAFEATSQHTRTDQMVGTVAYMAPERFDPADGRPVTAAADIFAWGAVVAYAATGRTPFAAESAPATAMRILTQPPDLSGLPESVRYAVERSLAKDPVERPGARELLDLLLAGGKAQPLTVTTRPLSGTAPPVSTAARPASGTVYPSGGIVPPADVLPASAPRRRSGKLVLAALAVALLAATGVVAARYLPRGSSASADPSLAPSAAAHSAAPSAAATLTAAERLAAIKGGRHRTLIHLAEDDRDLALDTHYTEVTAGDGTGAKSEFALIPLGVDYMIRTLRDPSDPREYCLGVKILKDGDARLVGADCENSEATVFSLLRTEGNKTDDKNRPTFWIYNETYGYVQWDSAGKYLYVQEVGDAPPVSTYSFVDRGPLPSPSPS
ncbi:serine/threonine protein kinase [Actinoplanes awajinensis]|uniref:Serine/threonine protein kinase n=1 Tax=Actinoplanes awajinensis subsp. mycoplanecinus TaxID=135947 RepID=A0A117MRD1_9ACTN|nr:serine/threonine-protein kinase [Actinoplanes awajinensis]KUL31541.1 serine/threonine protein kinase [Actinoplanes awajinensis subsp. mycoplanecinus]